MLASVNAPQKPIRQQPRQGPEPAGDVIYRIDPQDVIYAVNHHWTEFAQANGTPDVAASVIGQPVWDFIAGREVRELYGAMFERLRRFRRPVRFEFRCDAPGRRRWIRMAFHRLPGGGIEFHNRTVRTEDRPDVALIDPAVPRTSEDVLHMCSWCKRVPLGPKGPWVEPETAVRRMGLFGDAPMPQISHGVCGDCERRLLGAADSGP